MLVKVYGKTLLRFKKFVDAVGSVESDKDLLSDISEENCACEIYKYRTRGLGWQQGCHQGITCPVIGDRYIKFTTSVEAE